jgi:transcriptional regulator with XRE-family HTH domain
VGFEFLGLLQPQDMRRRIGELGLTQRSFAERLGVAPETVSRWLNGLCIRTRTLDNLKRVFFGFALVRDVLPPDGPARTLGRLTAESGVPYER